MASGFGGGFNRTAGGSAGRLGNDRFKMGRFGQQELKDSKPDATEEITQGLAAVDTKDDREVLAKKMPPGTMAVAKEKVLTNIYGVRLPDDKVYMYDVSVTAVTRNNKQFDMTKSSRDDYTSILRKRICCTIFYIINKCEKKVFGDSKVFYDGQKMLFSFSKLDLGPQNRFKSTVNLSQYEMKFENVEEVEFVFQTSIGNSEFLLNDLSPILDDTNIEANRAILQFLDIASSQTVFFDPDDFVSYPGGISYLVDPVRGGFTEADVPSLPEGKFVTAGARKSSLAVEGTKGRGEVRTAIALDTSKTACHLYQNVYEKALRIVGASGRVDSKSAAVLRQQLTGLFVEKHAKDENAPIKICDVTPQSSLDVQFEYQGSKISVCDYYKMRYGITLKFPDAPLLVGLSKKSGGGKSYFPMEICDIIENQRVKRQQQTPLQLKEMREACIVPPFKRTEQNRINVNALDLPGEANPYLAGSDIKVTKNSLALDARILPMPDVAYQNARAMKLDIEKMWATNNNCYVLPAEVPLWAIYLISSDQRVGARELSEFVKRLMDACSARGMAIREPGDMNQIEPKKFTVEKTFEIAAEAKCEFIFFVQNDQAKMHETIKDMERKYEIVTQDMKISKMLDIIHKNRRQTLENVINKMNVKLGGINYGVVPCSGCPSALKENRLYVGIAMSHPDPETPAAVAMQGSRAPTAIGFAANCGKTTYDFVGDFCYHDGRRADLISSIELTMERVLQLYKNSHKSQPSEVVIYRGGLSEGQYKMLLDEEIPLIRKTFTKAGCGATKLTVIVVNKLHNIRIVPAQNNPRDSASRQNVKPGTVLDAGLVHPKFNEFYLNSHKTLQGTARIPRYTVLVDDLRLSMDELEMMTYTLCFCHQIVNLPTSTPTPFYVASRYAERGRALWRERCYDPEARAPPSNIEQLNMQLPYFGTELARKRINA